MANSTLAHITRYFQSANADAQTIKEDFLLRTTEFDIIMGDIRNNPMKGSVQHYLLTGRRGSGKSTLLKRIQVELEDDEQLNQKFVPINLAEEQANIYRLYDLLLEITQELEEKGIEVRMPAEDDDCNTYARRLFAAIHEAIEQSGKKIILLLDNIDRIFDNLREDSSLLREMLLNYDDIKIIGGSTKMSEHFWEYNKPFYQFFRELPLQKLTRDEVKKLLLHWSEKPGNEELKNFIANRQGQIEMVRQLTDGLPRTLQFFVKILIGNEHESGYEYMRQIMDVVTPLYQERLNTLPAAQRKIVLQMAFIWEAAGAKDIAVVTHIPTSNVSGQLRQLIDKGIAEKVETSIKNHLYRLAERFFNLWLIFTQGSPKEKRRAKYLTIFMENFYDGDGLRDMAVKHLKMLQDNKMSPDKAVMLTKALAQSRYIDSAMRDDLIQYTLQLNITEAIKEHMPTTIAVLKQSIDELIEKREWEKALKLAEGVEQEDGIREHLLGIIYQFSNDDDKAVKHYTLAITKGNIDALFNIGVLFAKQKKYKKAEEYYLKSITNGRKNVLINLGNLYFDQQKYDQAKDYYLTAVANGENEALNNIANIYVILNQHEKAKTYYLEAVEKGDISALNNLGFLYLQLRKYELAKEYFIKAIAKGSNEALINLGNLHIAKNEYETAENYFKEAWIKKQSTALANLGSLYFNQYKFNLAEEYWRLAVANGDYGVVILLVMLYVGQEKYKEAEQMLNDIDDIYGFMGRSVLAISYYQKGINRVAALAQSKKAKKLIEFRHADALIDVWNGNIEDALVTIYQVVREKKYDVLEIILEGLLHHHQNNLVIKLFNHVDFGQELRERFEPLFYVASMLSLKDSDTILKTPPEIQPTVDNILTIVKQKQEFYYGNKQ